MTVLLWYRGEEAEGERRSIHFESMSLSKRRLLKNLVH
jgi:hypothetical protein